MRSARSRFQKSLWQPKVAAEGYERQQVRTREGESGQPAQPLWFCTRKIMRQLACRQVGSGEWRPQRIRRPHTKAWGRWFSAAAGKMLKLPAAIALYCSVHVQNVNNLPHPQHINGTGTHGQHLHKAWRSPKGLEGNTRTGYPSPTSRTVPWASSIPRGHCLGRGRWEEGEILNGRLKFECCNDLEENYSELVTDFSYKES